MPELTKGQSPVSIWKLPTMIDGVRCLDDLSIVDWFSIWAELGWTSRRDTSSDALFLWKEQVQVKFTSDRIAEDIVIEVNSEYSWIEVEKALIELRERFDMKERRIRIERTFPTIGNWGLEAE